MLSCYAAAVALLRSAAEIGLSPFVYKLDSGWESQMLSRMGSQQSMTLLAQADTARFDAQKLARDVVCFLQDSHSTDRDKCQWVDSRADSPWRGRKLLRVRCCGCAVGVV